MKYVGIYDQETLTASITTKYVFGVVESYNKIFPACTAARDTIGEAIDLSGTIVDRHRRKLIKAGHVTRKNFNRYHTKRLNSGKHYTIIPLKWIKHFGGGRKGRAKAYIVALVHRAQTWERTELRLGYIVKMTGMSRWTIRRLIKELENDRILMRFGDTFLILDKTLASDNPYDSEAVAAAREERKIVATEDKVRIVKEQEMKVIVEEVKMKTKREWERMGRTVDEANPNYEIQHRQHPTINQKVPTRVYSREHTEPQKVIEALSNEDFAQKWADLGMSNGAKVTKLGCKSYQVRVQKLPL